MRLYSKAPQYSGFEQRWFATVLVYTVAPIALVLVHVRPRGVDFWWDFAMAIGGAAAAGLALLPLLSARWWAAQYPATGFLRLVQTVHRELAYVALGMVVAHAGLLLVLEGRVLEYLKLGAAAGMLAGLVASLLLIALIVSSRYRDLFRFSYRGWRRWHVVLSVAAVGLTGWHLLAAGYYFMPRGKWVGLVWLLSVPTALTVLLRHWRLSPQQRVAPSISHEPGRARRVVFAISLVWIAAATGLAWWGTAQPPLEEQALCAVAPCL